MGTVYDIIFPDRIDTYEAVLGECVIMRLRRVPNRRGYIVMADTFTWFIKYCCIIDVFMRNERCAFFFKIGTSGHCVLPQPLLFTPF